MKARFSLQHWIDPDQIAKAIASDRRETIISETVSREAFNQARNTRCAYGLSLQDFGFETVFSHGSNLAFLRALKEIDYEVHLYYVSTDDVQINIARIRNRVIRGEYDVPENKVRERYARSLLLLSLAVRDCDRVVFFDNSRPFQIVGSSEIAGKRAGDINNDLTTGRRRQISLFPPIPTWLLTYGIFPYALSWPTSDLAKSAKTAFGDDINFTPEADLTNQSGRERFLRQFTFS